MSIIGIIVTLIIVCLLWWALTTIMGAFGVPAPISTVAMVIFVVLVVLWLVSLFGGPYLGTLGNVRVR